MKKEAETTEKPEEFKRFEEFTRKLVSVPKRVIDEREREYQRQKQQKKEGKAKA